MSAIDAMNTGVNKADVVLDFIGVGVDGFSVRDDRCTK